MSAQKSQGITLLLLVIICLYVSLLNSIRLSEQANGDSPTPSNIQQQTYTNQSCGESCDNCPSSSENSDNGIATEHNSSENSDNSTADGLSKFAIILAIFGIGYAKFTLLSILIKID